MIPFLLTWWVAHTLTLPHPILLAAFVTLCVGIANVGSRDAHAWIARRRAAVKRRGPLLLLAAIGALGGMYFAARRWGANTR